MVATSCSKLSDFVKSFVFQRWWRRTIPAGEVSVCPTLKSFVFQRWWRRTIPAGKVSVCSTWNLDIFISCSVRCQSFSDNKFFCVCDLCEVSALCIICYSFVYHSYFCTGLLLFVVHCATHATQRAPEDGDPTPQLMPMDAVGDLVSKLTQSIGDKFGEFVVSLKEKEVDVQRETRAG